MITAKFSDVRIFRIFNVWQVIQLFPPQFVWETEWVWLNVCTAPHHTAPGKMLYRTDGNSRILPTYFVPDPSINNVYSVFEVGRIGRVVISNTIEKRVPSKMTTSRHINPWVNIDMKRLMRRKQRAYRKGRRTNAKRDLDRYKRLQREVQYKIRKANKSYMETQWAMIVRTTLRNSGHMWKAKDKNSRV